MERIKACEKTMQEVQKMNADKKDSTYKAFKKIARVTSDSLKAIKKILFQPEDVQGIFRNPDIVTAKIRGLYGVIYEIKPLNASQKLELKQSEEIIRTTVQRINHFLENEWKNYRQAAGKVGFSPFKDYKPLEL
jgi:NACalpha-BTF3-like transcription factor